MELRAARIQAIDTDIPRLAYLNYVPYFLAISFNCLLVRCIGAASGREATSLKKHSNPAGATVQSNRISQSAFSKPCQEFFEMECERQI